MHCIGSRADETHIQTISAIRASVVDKLSSGLDQLTAEASAPLFLEDENGGASWG